MNRLDMTNWKCNLLGHKHPLDLSKSGTYVNPAIFHCVRCNTLLEIRTMDMKTNMVTTEALSKRYTKFTKFMEDIAINGKPLTSELINECPPKVQASLLKSLVDNNCK